MCEKTGTETVQGCGYHDVAVPLWEITIPFCILKTEAATFRDKQNSHSCFEQKTEMSLVTSSNIETQRIQMEGNIQTLLYTVIVSLHKFFTKIKSIWSHIQNADRWEYLTYNKKPKQNSICSYLVPSGIATSSFSQVITGVGIPSIWHSKRAAPPVGTFWGDGSRRNFDRPAGTVMI